MEDATLCVDYSQGASDFDYGKGVSDYGKSDYGKGKSKSKGYGPADGPPSKRGRLRFETSDVVFKFLVTPNAAGKIIGRGGSGVIMLRQQLGVTIHIDEFICPATNMQVVLLGGPRASVEQAFGCVLEKMTMDEQHPRKNGDLIVSTFMTRNCISKVIGNKGATIVSMRQESGCAMKADMENFEGEQLLHITGQPEAIAYALQLVAPIVEESADSCNLNQSNRQGFAGLSFGGKGGCAAVKGTSGGDGKSWSAGKASAGKAFPGKADGGFGFGFMGGLASKGAKGGKFEALEGGKGSWDGGKSFSGGGFTTKGKGGGDVAAAFEEKLFSGEQTLQYGEGGLPLESAAEDTSILESQCSIMFPIPIDAVSRVLGKGGVYTEEIRRVAGVTLKIDTGASAMVHLSGSVVGVQMAHCMVLARVRSQF